MTQGEATTTITNNKYDIVYVCWCDKFAKTMMSRLISTNHQYKYQRW